MTLFVVQSGMGATDDYDDASKLIEQVDQYASPELKLLLEGLTGCGETWLTLVGLVHELPQPRTVAAVVDLIRAMDPVELRTLIMQNAGIRPGRGFDPELTARIAKGSTDALDEMLEAGHHASGLKTWLELSPEETRATIAEVLERFDAEVLAHVQPTARVLERDAAEKRTLAATMSADRLIETATNGVAFEMQAHVSGVLLVPSIVLRPWVVITEHGSLRIFVYSVSDEHLNADPTAPPTYLVDTYKALGDEKRLRILSILAEGDLGLKEIADRIDLAKSTTHHHLRMLRTAGLVRIIISDTDKRYSLRRDGLPETARLLDAYLTPPAITTERLTTEEV
jgi:DNA-binding transcriptional ArsR family regulator